MQAPMPQKGLLHVRHTNPLLTGTPHAFPLHQPATIKCYLFCSSLQLLFNHLYVFLQSPLLLLFALTHMLHLYLVRSPL